MNAEHAIASLRKVAFAVVIVRISHLRARVTRGATLNEISTTIHCVSTELNCENDDGGDYFSRSPCESSFDQAARLFQKTKTTYVRGLHQASRLSTSITVRRTARKRTN